MMILCLPLFSMAVGQLSSCLYVYQSPTTTPVEFQRDDYKQIRKYLTIPSDLTGSYNKQTTFFRGHTGRDQIEFYKPYFLRWGSRYGTTSQGFTPQGDIRWFPAFVGAELASRFRFEIGRGLTGYRVLAPTANSIKETVIKLNEQLVKNNKNPIIFLPVKTGFLTSEQALRLSASATNGFSIFFPYEDNHPQLTLHDTAWHLGAMLYPKQFHEKSRQIDDETLRVVDLLRASGLPRADEVAALLIHERSYENDAGNANLFATLADLRIHNQLKPFKELKAQLSKADLYVSGIRSIEWLTRPGFSAPEAVARRLYSSLQLEDEVPNAREFEQSFIHKESPTHGKKLMLTETEKKLYALFLNNYRSTPSYRTSQKMIRETSQNLLTHFMDTLDERLEDVTEAFRQIAISEKTP